MFEIPRGRYLCQVWLCFDDPTLLNSVKFVLKGQCLNSGKSLTVSLLVHIMAVSPKSRSAQNPEAHISTSAALNDSNTGPVTFDDFLEKSLH